MIIIVTDRIVFSIMNDMILNRRVSITDKEALRDAQQSLSNMIYDFLSQHKFVSIN